MLDEILEIEAVDQHVDNVRREECELPFIAAFTEATDPAVWEHDAPQGLFFRRSVKQLAELYGCEARLEAVLEARARLDLEERTRLCIERSRLRALLLDDGLSPDEVMPWDWHGSFVPVKRFQRVEHLASQLFEQCESFEEFDREFSRRLEQGAPEVVGFKCIAAYRGGLDVPEVSAGEARADYPRARKSRPSRSHFYSYLVHRALEIAHEQQLPVQFHTGFGDPNLSLEGSNPLLLRPLIERYRCPFVLLHAGYPYVRETGFLASVYRNAWADFGLALPFISVAGMRRVLAELIELTPLNKLLYSSDASIIPELYFLGSLNSRRSLVRVLEECVVDGDLDREEALQAAHGILHANATRLYRLEP